MQINSVLISGASIAGPALAYWLDRYGCAVTVVERNAALRPGGQAVDFKGATHRKVLEEMGILAEIERRQTGKTDLLIVDDGGTRLATIPGEFIGGDVEILRGDLSEILYERTRDTVEYIFGDSISSLTETATGVDVEFENAEPRTFDLVVGADGIHSIVRRLAFGPESDYVKHLGYYYAVVGGSPVSNDAAETRERAVGLMYNVPGRMAVLGGSKAPELYVFASGPRDYDRRDVEAQKQILVDAFAGVGWQVPEMIAALPEASDFYLDAIARVAMDRYSTGRVVLIGDSAYGNTLGGFGTGLGIVGAYVLAGELAAADGDHRIAFEQYNIVMHRYAKVARKGSAGPFLAPSSPLRLWLRNATFKYSFLLNMMMKMTDNYANDVDLRDYPLPPS
ncbi:FAD-dependent monooxygenase [Antrihabitans cavernicola]|uniref:FAD-dependent oxidoreductase n=1 Tax=Antrihabitans cavernicola TaxID=2495913 RepID=A0A5A7S3L2_9NOCA|nr:FAD-dependent monooxygenase [Spelaeibacter cavernicola]KAA0019475.1 FAD-dependent oxidoreductase [Spelaeibacter cavernicola]